MASLLTAGSPAHAAETDSTINDDQLVNDIVTLWESENKRSLDVRLETGARLNDRLGSPTERQSRGQGVLRQIAKALDQSYSELSRMRWLAYLMSTKGEESCWAGVPEGRRTWTKFKKILPVLKGHKPKTEKKGSASGKKKVAALSRVLKMMDSAASKLRNGSRKIVGAKREKLVAKLKEFVSAISASTGIHLSVSENAE